MLILFYSILCLFLLDVNNAEKVCDAETGVCRMMEATKKCNVHSSWCASTTGKGGKGRNYGSLYRHGGSAQAYKPQAPIKTTVCDDDSSSSPSSSAIASWPFSRGSMKSPPRLVFHVTLWSCGGSSSSKPSSPDDKDEDCCCQVLSAASTSSNNHTTLEIWQARPDGSYSSLRPDTQEGDCRARILVSNDATTATTTTSKNGIHVVTFTTLPPGSTGSLSGLGPGGWDTFPYGPPKLHLLVTSPGHAPTLVDIPVLFHRKTWEQQTASSSFWGPDWRGVAWMLERPAAPAYHITNWKPNVKQGLIDIDLDLFLQVWNPEENAITTSAALDDAMFCPSWIYGLPWSFFLQPIRICAPALLDFFAL